MFVDSLSRMKWLLLLSLLISPGRSQAQHGDDEKSLSAKQLQPAEGLKVETFAADPLFFNPVAFSIDEKGRFFISETHRYKDAIFDIWKADDRWKMNDFSFRTVEDRAKFLAQEYATNLTALTKDSEIIRLVEDKDGDGKAETTSIFADGFNQTVSGTAAGVLARKGELWFTCIPDVWKFKYSNDGKKLSQEKLHSGYGVKISVSGHDLHGLAMGPDGRIYFSVGDRGANVETREGKKLESIDTGAVFRCNPDGTELEIFATGVRNPQELAFDEFGNLWAHDNDTSGDDKSRVLHIVEGGDYGWRQAYQFMPEFGPWVQEKVWEGVIDGVLPPAGYGAQGPAGLAFYPGTGLPEKYNGAMLACDFPQGVWAYFKKEKGASYQIEREKFLWGLGATDVDFGPNGDVYVSDWGKSYNMPDAGRIYRVFDPTQNATSNSSAARSQVSKILSAGMEKTAVDELTKLLGHSDMRIRMEAQFEFARRGAESVPTLASVTKTSTDRLARHHAIWSMTQIVRKASSGSAFLANDVMTRTKVISTAKDLAQHESAETRADAAAALGELHAPEGADTLIPLLSDKEARVRFHAAMSLGKLKEKKAIQPLFAFLKENNNQDAFLTHAGVWALVQIGDFDAIAQASSFENPTAMRRAALLCMRRMERPEIARFLQDPEPKLVLEAARAINDVPIPGAMPDLAQNLEDCKCGFPAELKTPFFNRAINAAYRLGQKPQFAKLVNMIVAAKVPEADRAQAINALADWHTPGPLDRVTGIYRPLTNARTTLVSASLEPLLSTQIGHKSTAISTAAIRCARNLKVVNATPLIRRVFTNTTLVPALRRDALLALAELKDAELHTHLEQALADTDSSLRSEAIKMVGQLNPAQATPLLEKLLATDIEIRIGQTVYTTLGDLKDAAADNILTRQLDQLLAGKIKAELQLDLIEAAEKRSVPVVQEKLKQYKTSLSQSDAIAEYRACLLGGDSVAGKKLFNENDALGCLRCHSVKGKGGVVGPDLAGLASRATREHVVESILFPNKGIAAGYENVLLNLSNGQTYAGLVKSETDSELVLNSPEDGIMTLRKSEITRRERGLSAMPDGLGALLTKRDLRDLIEYLSTFK